MIDYIPSRENNAYIVVPILTSLITIICETGYFMGIAFAPYVLGMIGVLFCIVSLYFIFRYTLTFFRYTFNSYGDSLLEVYKTTAGVKRIYCTVNRQYIVDVYRSKKDIPKNKYKRKVNACTNIFPKDACYIVVNNDDCYSMLIIEADNQLFEALKNH